MSSDLLLGLLNAVAFMFCVSFVAYVTMIILPYMRHRLHERGDNTEFKWHFLVPCLNEEAVIAATVEHLVSTFPHADLWCIDDGSADATPQVLAGLARHYRRVHVVTRQAPDAQVGKGPALNAGWRAIRASLPVGADLGRHVVGVLDADSRLDPSALDAIAGPRFFADPSVGAVQIEVRVTSRRQVEDSGPPSLLVKLQDLEFSGPIAAMQMLRRRSGSVGMGGNGQFSRLSILDEIAATGGTPWHGALLEDFELGLHVLLAGSRTEYCHDTWVEQEGLPNIAALVRQRSRWAQGSMQCFQYLRAVLRCPSISTAGAVEIVYFLCIPWTQLMGAILYGASFIVMMYYAVFNPGGFGGWLSDGAWGVLPLFLLFGVGPFLVWGPIYRLRSDRGLTRRKALLLGVANWAYSYLQYAAVWWAFARIVRSRSDWKKTARPAIGPIVIPYGGVPQFAGRFVPRREGTALTRGRLTIGASTRNDMVA